MILGVDVHAGYGRIDWQRVAAAGVQFAIVKCSEGNEAHRNDPRWEENIKGAYDAGLYVGSYHFAYSLPTKKAGDMRSPEDEARRAFGACHGHGRTPGELPHFLDAEWPEVGEWGKWGCTAPQLSDWYRRYCEEATRLWGRAPVIYTYPFFWRTIAASADVSWAKDYKLWIASDGALQDWLPGDGKRPIVPPPWDDWTFWQFGFNGSRVAIPGIPSVPVDRDCFHGTLDDLRRLALIEPDADTQPEGVDPAETQQARRDMLSEAMAERLPFIGWTEPEDEDS